MDTTDGWPQGRPKRPAPSPEHDVHSTLRITAGEAERGVMVPVMLPGGRETEVHVPAGTEDGTRIRLPGEGFGRKRGLVFARTHHSGNGVSVAGGEIPGTTDLAQGTSPVRAAQMDGTRDSSLRSE
jgi:hypothetical protein